MTANPYQRQNLQPGEQAKNLSTAWSKFSVAAGGACAALNGFTVTGANPNGIVSGTAAGGANYGGSFAPITTGLPIGTTTVPHSPRPLKTQWCEQTGHVMSKEVEWAFGFIMGVCENCGEKITGRRIAGGLAVEQLRALIEGSLDDEQALTDLCTDVVRMQELIESEERALQAARSMLALARRKIAQRAIRFAPTELQDISAA